MTVALQQPWRIGFEKFADLTWELLNERDDSVNISHGTMPTYEAHRAFVMRHPYREWLAVTVGDTIVGSIYLTNRNEVGIFIYKAHQGKGYGTAAIMEIMRRYHPLPAEPSVRPGHYVANVNPRNTASVRMFEKLGRHISNTYELKGQR